MSTTKRSTIVHKEPKKNAQFPRMRVKNTKKPLLKLPRTNQNTQKDPQKEEEHED